MKKEFEEDNRSALNLNTGEVEKDKDHVAFVRTVGGTILEGAEI